MNKIKLVDLLLEQEDDMRTAAQKEKMANLKYPSKDKKGKSFSEKFTKYTGPSVPVAEGEGFGTTGAVRFNWGPYGKKGKYFNSGYLVLTDFSQDGEKLGEIQYAGDPFTYTDAGGGKMKVVSGPSDHKKSLGAVIQKKSQASAKEGGFLSNLLRKIKNIVMAGWDMAKDLYNKAKKGVEMAVDKGKELAQKAYDKTIQLSKDKLGIDLEKAADDITDAVSDGISKLFGFTDEVTKGIMEENFKNRKNSGILKMSRRELNIMINEMLINQ